VLSVEGLEVSIGAVRVLRGVTLRLAEGELAGLVGRNGAGKTTLLRTVAGALPARAGAIALEGAPITSVAAHRRARLGIGWMPEDRRIIPQLTVEENLMLPAWAAGDDAGGRERLRRVYGLIPEVEALKARRGRELSGGQQKLAALGRALMVGTKLLLLDEPFEGVAPVLARRLAEVVRALRSERVTVLVAESDASHAKDLLDTVHHIDRGAIAPAPRQEKP
jgi:branched-chain amino acid transport system ATP-binding protein